MYYTYAYLREDNTPYYIGKGKGKRVFEAHNVSVPPTDRILYLKQNLTEEEAIKHEIYMISVLGRKDIGTGILRNLTDGGDGASGYKHTEEHKRWMSERMKTYERTEEHKRKLKLNRPKTISEEHKRKIGEANIRNGNKPPIRTYQSEDEKQKRKESLKKFYQEDTIVRKKLSDKAKVRKRNSRGHFI